MIRIFNFYCKQDYIKTAGKYPSFSNLQEQMQLLTLGQFQKIFKDFQVTKSHEEVVRTYIEASKNNKDKKNLNFYQFISSVYKLLASWQQVRKVFHLNDKPKLNSCLKAFRPAFDTVDKSPQKMGNESSNDSKFLKSSFKGSGNDLIVANLNPKEKVAFRAHLKIIKLKKI